MTHESWLQGAWEPGNLAHIERVCTQAPPGSWAVFDWDNTSILGDIQEAVLRHQLHTMTLGVGGTSLRDILEWEVPGDAHKPLMEDVLSLHQKLEGRSDLLGSHTHDAFVIKTLAMYNVLLQEHPAEIGYAWISRLLCGLTREEVTSLTQETIATALDAPLTPTHRHTEHTGHAGPTSISWKPGLRCTPGMQSLYQGLPQQGIQVHVCSASFVDCVRTFATHPSYGITPDRVHAVELDRDGKGRIEPTLSRSLTQATGKTDVLRKEVTPDYTSGPLFVAGDSIGDLDMMFDFEDTKLSLLIHRDKPGHVKEVANRALSERNMTAPRVILQGRDETSGCLIQSHTSRNINHFMNNGSI